MTALRGLLILLICLIILPVLVYSNHFSQETFATSNTEDLDSGGNGGDKENNNDPGQEGSDNSIVPGTSAGGDLAKGEVKAEREDDGDSAGDLAGADGSDSAETSGGLAVGEVPPPEPRTFLHSSTSDSR